MHTSNESSKNPNLILLAYRANLEEAEPGETNTVEEAHLFRWGIRSYFGNGISWEYATEEQRDHAVRVFSKIIAVYGN